MGGRTDKKDLMASGQATARLSNGWKLTPKRVAGEMRIEIIGPSYANFAELIKDGVIKTKVGSDTRLFIPTGPEGVKVLQRITEFKPVVDEMDKSGQTTLSTERVPGFVVPSGLRLTFPQQPPSQTTLSTRVPGQRRGWRLVFPGG
jgi:hypothetical protein